MTWFSAQYSSVYRLDSSPIVRFSVVSKLNTLSRSINDLNYGTTVYVERYKNQDYESVILPSIDEHLTS